MRGYIRRTLHLQLLLFIYSLTHLSNVNSKRVGQQKEYHHQHHNNHFDSLANSTESGIRLGLESATTTAFRLGVSADQTIDHCEIIERFVEIKGYEECVRCQRGFLVSANRTSCIVKVQDGDEKQQNCIQIGLFGECLVCECGYALLTSIGYCVPVPAFLHGCQVFDENDHCLRPKAAFQLMLDADSLVKSSTKQVEFAHGSNCEIKKENSCLRCHHGFKLIYSTNVCERVPYVVQNSMYSYFSIDHKLESRDIRLIAFERGVHLTIRDCHQHGIYIELSSPTIKCVKCLTGRIPNESGSQCHRIPFELCGKVLDQNESTCSECMEPRNYYIQHIPQTASKCVPRSRNNRYSYFDGCLVYEESADACKSCRPYFTLVANTCVINRYYEQMSLLHHHAEQDLVHVSTPSPPHLIPNCAMYLSDKICTECELGFTLSVKNTCEIERDENCLISDPVNTSCAVCVTGMEYIHMYGKCAASNKACIDYKIVEKSVICILCKPGYFINQMSECQELTNCKLSDGILPICDLCESLYYLNPSMDKSIVECKQISEFQYCYESNGLDFICLTCKKHFILDNFSCIPQVRHNEKGICEIYGFYISDLSQEFCDEHSSFTKMNCEMLDPRSDKCQKCQSGFFFHLFRGYCVEIKGCLISNGISDKCLLTVDSGKYIDAEGHVQNSPNGCFSNQRDLNCLRYKNGMEQVSLILDEQGNSVGDVDIEKIDFDKREFDNCQVFERVFLSVNTYACVQCKNLFYVNHATNLCESLAIKYCLVSDGRARTCLACMEGYGLASDIDGSMVCVLIPMEKDMQSRCVKMKDGRCEQCEPFFYVSMNGRVCTAIDNPKCQSSGGVTNNCTCMQQFKNAICEFEFCEIIDYVTQRCAKCFDQFDLLLQNDPTTSVSKAICLIKPQMYCKWAQKKGLCETCQEGYYKNKLNYQYQICSRITMRNCQKMKDMTFACETCVTGYFLSQKGVCYSVEHCKVFTTKCVSCESPYVPNAFNVCVEIPNCLTTQDTVCSLCRSTFYLSQDQMECLPIQNCEVSSGYFDSCDVCKPFFHRIAQICVPTHPIKYCVHYDDNSKMKCSKCAKLYYLISDGSSCSRIDSFEFCADSDGITNVCNQCETSGFALTRVNSCEKIGNCILSNGFDFCYLCSISFYVQVEARGMQKSSDNGEEYNLNNISNRNMKSICVPRKVAIPNCVVYSFLDDERCERCDSKFYLAKNRNQCIPLMCSEDSLEGLESCIRKRTNSSSSNVTPSGLGCFYSNGITNECMLCVKEQKSNQNINISQPARREDHFESYFVNCASIWQDGFRNACSSNHFSSSNECLPRLVSVEWNDNCKEYHTDRNACKICLSGYILRTDYFDGINENVNGHQSSTNSINDSFCERIPLYLQVENCAEYYPNSYLCARCESRQILDIAEYFLDMESNTCVDVLRKKCEKRESNDMRGEGQSLESYLAECKVKDIPFCLEVERRCPTCEVTNCLRCMNSYYSKSNECVKQPYYEGCKVYSWKMEDRCDECEEGYYLFGFLCLRISDENCEPSHFNNYGCALCKPGYSVRKDIGLQCQKSEFPNCNWMHHDYEQDKLKCKQCNKGFEFERFKLGYCVRKHDSPHRNCIQFSAANPGGGGGTTGDSQIIEQTKCTECKIGFFLSESSNGCVDYETSVCSIQKCRVYSSSLSLPDKYACQECQQGFQLDSDNLCVQVQQEMLNDENITKKGEDRTNENEKQEEQSFDYAVAVFIGIACCLCCCGIGLIFIRIRKSIIRKSESENKEGGTHKNSDSSVILSAAFNLGEHGIELEENQQQEEQQL